MKLKEGTRVALPMRRGVVTNVTAHGFWMRFAGEQDSDLKTWVSGEDPWLEESFEPAPPKNLKEELSRALNKWSAENGSNTPDFILARYLTDCLAAFERASNHRGEWHSPEGVTTVEFHQ